MGELLKVKYLVNLETGSHLIAQISLELTM